MAHKRQIYLEDIGLDDARQRYDDALAEASFGLIDAETVSLADALHRVTAAPVWARISAPHYYAAAMDGAAVRAGETTGATETSPLRLLLGGQAVWVDTGDAMPPGFDAVIMIEQIQELPDGAIAIHAPVAPWQ